MTMKQISKYYLISLIVLSFCLSCSKEDNAGVVRYGGEIRFNTSLAETKGATLFEGDDPLKNISIGGGDFTVHAYESDDMGHYINDAWVSFFKGGTDKWHFRDDGGTPSDITDDAYIDYYWPEGHNLDFFAYMPYMHRMDNTYVTVIDDTSGGSPYFTCELPLDNDQDQVQEFIYAYASDQNRNTQGTDGVKLRFIHPFSTVVVRLEESYRMTIKTISFENIYYSGTYSVDFSTIDSTGDHTCWNTQGKSKSDMILEINEPVPGDKINFNTEVGGPYMVLPQNLDGVTFSITFDRDDVGEATRRIAVKTLSVPSWEPGKRYTYDIILGDPQEEILFNVLVDEWNVVDYKQEIDVE